MIADAGGKLYACKASVDMFGLKKRTSAPGRLDHQRRQVLRDLRRRRDHLHLVNPVGFRPGGAFFRMCAAISRSISSPGTATSRGRRVAVPELAPVRRVLRRRERRFEKIAGLVEVKVVHPADVDADLPASFGPMVAQFFSR